MKATGETDGSEARRRVVKPFRSALALDSQLLREHPALLFTLGYVAMSMIGMMFSWSLFRRFGVDIFDYAEITDFLMAALREPLTFLVAAGGVVMAWGVWWWSEMEQRFFARRPPRSALGRGYQRWSRWSAESPALLLTVIALYAYVFIAVYAEFKVRQIRDGGGEHVLVSQDGDAAPRARILLGTTSKLTFLLDASAGEVEIIPYESLKEIEVVAQDLRRDSQTAEFPRPVKK